MGFPFSSVIKIINERRSTVIKAIDVGFGGVKAISDSKSITFPSAIGCFSLSLLEFFYDLCSSFAVEVSPYIF